MVRHQSLMSAVVLDGSGHLRSTSDLSATTPELLAAAACASVSEIAGVVAAVVTCSVLSQGPGAFAMVMLREHPDGGFRSGTAAAENSADAVVKAVLSALDLAGGVLPAIAERWAARSDVSAASVIEGHLATTAIGELEHVEAHKMLVRTMPAAGRLAVTTEDTEYRVLRLSAVSVAVSTKPGARSLDAIDTWMARAEALAS